MEYRRSNPRHRNRSPCSPSVAVSHLNDSLMNQVMINRSHSGFVTVNSWRNLDLTTWLRMNCCRTIERRIDQSQSSRIHIHSSFCQRVEIPAARPCDGGVWVMIFALALTIQLSSWLIFMIVGVVSEFWICFCCWNSISVFWICFWSNWFYGREMLYCGC